MANHYVLVIHGTWNPPDTESPRWHQLNESDPDNFCRQLNDRLEARGLGRPVWRSCGTMRIAFGWTGGNSHEDRIKAGEALLTLLREIIKADQSARIHLVAHSHGANVVLLGLQKYLEFLRDQGREIFTAAARLPREDNQGQTAIRAIIRERVGTLNLATDGDGASLLTVLQEFWPHSGPTPLEVSRQSPDMPQQRPNDSASSAWTVLRRIKSLLAFVLKAYPYHFKFVAYRERFGHAWMTSKATNRIGRIVFLGGPFLEKLWIKRSLWSPSSLLGSTIDFLTAVPLAALGTYFLIEITWFVYVWFIGSLIRSVVHFDADLFPVFNPLEWPTWLQWVAAAFAALYSMIFFRQFGGWKRRDVNVYFDANEFPHQSDSAMPAADSVLPYETLVVHAGLLDEAILGLSTEPLIFGTIAPQIRSLLQPALAFRVESLPIGRDLAPQNVVTRFLVAIGRTFLGLVTWISRPLLGLWERFLVTKLLEIISSPAFGLPAREFVNARILPRHDIGQPKFFRETCWDVSQLLLRSPAKNRDPADDLLSRYDFLWSSQRQQQRLADSWLWKHLSRSLRDIERRRANVSKISSEAIRDQLAPVALVLEEKVREFVGAVQLLHSAYYSNTSVIDGLATFIAKGTVEAEQKVESQTALIRSPS